MLHVHVLGKLIGTLESRGDFASVMAYRENVSPQDFVSLTMPVRDEPYVWDDTLHPIFQMNLPEGYLLQVLQEAYGPLIGASPHALLAVIGRSMIGRVQVAPPGAALDEPATPLDVAELLQGDNAEAAFALRVREHATSGVSGVLPKFLDTQVRIAQHTKTTLFTHRHIVKGSSNRLPYVALNEHLCMEVVRQMMPAAATEVSDDGQVLLVHRFDVDADGQRCYGLEDFCVLLGLRSAAKYETTWERIARAVGHHVPLARRAETNRQLATLILLNYALRNADCHAKNIALRYTSREDVHLAPAYDVITTAAYPEYASSPPGISFRGRKTWAPGDQLKTFLTSTFDVPARDQVTLVDKIGTAMLGVAPAVLAAMEQHPGFRETGKRMLLSWHEGLSGLHDSRVYAMPDRIWGEAVKQISDAEEVTVPRNIIGRSELLGRR